MPGRISAVAGSKGGPSDNGIVTPGQTTVNSEKRQFSTGLTFDELVQKYGAKQQGKGPRERGIAVPESAQGKYVYNINEFWQRANKRKSHPNERLFPFGRSNTG